MLSNFTTISFEPIYGISKQGVVINLQTNKILKPFITKKGYLRITFKNKKKYLIHRLVALVYLNNPNNLLQVNHKDGNKLNNCISNLEWCNNDYNRNHAIQIGLWNNISLKVSKSQLGSNNSIAKLKENEVLEIVNKLNQGFKNVELGKMYNVSSSTINSIRKGKSWNHITNII